MGRDDFSITTPSGDVLEYIDDCHVYLVNGCIVPSITQLLGIRFCRKYDGIPRETLYKAAEYGTGVHRAIEMFCREGWTASETIGFAEEVRKFEWIQNKFQFKVEGTEIPVILYDNGEPIAAGRLDLLTRTQGCLGIADIKTTAKLDTEYLEAQLNLYRRAYSQTYGEKVISLDAIHIRRKEIKKYVPIMVNEELVDQIIHEYKLECEAKAQQIFKDKEKEIEE